MDNSLAGNRGKSGAAAVCGSIDSIGSVADADNADKNLRRAIRQLRRSGRRLVRQEESWAVLHGGQPVARLTMEEAAFLVAEGHVVEAEGGGLVIASSATEEHTSAPDLPPSGAWVFVAAGCRAPRTPGRGFEKLAHKARTGEGPLSLRQAEAGLRLIADAEAAARRPGLTMDWTNTVTDRQRRRGRDGGLGYVARAAAGRIDLIRQALGEDQFALLWRACIERRSISQLAAGLGVGTPMVARKLSLALEGIAAVYDKSN